MKNKKVLLLIIGIIVSMLLFTACDLLPLTNECEHEYVVISDTATCTQKGIITYKCEKCGKEKMVSVESSGHIYEEVSREDPTCTSEGYIKEQCTLCGKEKTTKLEMLDHDFTDWVTITEMTTSSDGEEERECKSCHIKETRLISRLPDMDLSVINCIFSPSEDNNYEVNTFDELAILFNMGLFNNLKTMNVTINFEDSDTDTFLNRLCATNTISIDYTVECGFKIIGDKIKSLDLSFSYYDINKSTPKEVSYKQYDSLNLTNITKTRNSDYDDFKINKVNYSCEVTTSEQLVYVLEHRVKPIPKVGSDAERLLNKMKDILRDIITDDMDDYQKIKAIHDYIIMNVTYDQELYDLTNTTTKDLKNYDGFYLEGVFDKACAVCEGISKAVCALANIEGIPCVRISGNQTGNPNSIGHAWNKVYIDGKWYILDATSDGSIVSDTYEVLSYAYFLISDEKMEETYTGKNYLDLECKENYDVLSNTTFEYKDNTYTFSAKSRSDLEKIVSYFLSIEKENITVQLKLDYKYKSFNEEFNAVSRKSFSYINFDEYYLLVK